MLQYFLACFEEKFSIGSVALADLSEAFKVSSSRYHSGFSDGVTGGLVVILQE